MSSFSKPDLVFLDLNLPIINGFDVLRDIKRRQFLQNTPVVIFTRSPKEGDMNKSYGLHASGFIHKSFSYNEVKQQLHRTLAYWLETVQLPN
jgi:CheY-like chemotaxis protein